MEGCILSRGTPEEEQEVRNGNKKINMIRILEVRNENKNINKNRRVGHSLWCPMLSCFIHKFN